MLSYAALKWKGKLNSLEMEIGFQERVGPPGCHEISQWAYPTVLENRPFFQDIYKNHSTR